MTGFAVGLKVFESVLGVYGLGSRVFVGLGFWGFKVLRFELLGCRVGGGLWHSDFWGFRFRGTKVVGLLGVGLGLWG